MLLNFAISSIGRSVGKFGIASLERAPVEYVSSLGALVSDATIMSYEEEFSGAPAGEMVLIDKSSLLASAAPIPRRR